MIDRIIHFSVTNKLITALGLLVFVVWGAYSFTQLPIDALPDVTNNQVLVNTVAPNLATQEVEQFITFPLELAFKNLPDLVELRSISRSGLSVITIVFKDEVPVNIARQLVAERITAAQASIPAGFGTPVISPATTGLGEIYQYTLAVDSTHKGKYTPMDLRSVQDWIVRRQLLGVPGVVDVSSFGGFLKQYEVAVDAARLQVEAFAFSKALETAWSVVARVDKMISEAKPWDLAKDENQKQTLNAVLYRAAETLRWLCVLLYPVMPNATVEIWAQIGLGNLPGSSASPGAIDPAKLKWGGLAEGTTIGQVKPLFPRIDKAKTMNEINEGVQSPTSNVQSPADTGTAGVQPAAGPGEHATEADAVAAGVTTFIDITDFTKVDLRVGEVLTAERIPKADKLLLLTVDVGEEKPRQILAGIAQYYDPEQLVGRKIAVVANLKPRKLRGHESQGMLLAASVGEEGKPVIATFTEDVPNGARLK